MVEVLTTFLSKHEDDINSSLVSGQTDSLIAKTSHSSTDSGVNIVLLAASENNDFSIGDLLIFTLDVVQNVHLSIEILAPEIDDVDVQKLEIDLFLAPVVNINGVQCLGSLVPEDPFILQSANSAILQVSSYVSSLLDDEVINSDLVLWNG
jgi:hypothetical protein